MLKLGLVVCLLLSHVLCMSQQAMVFSRLSMSEGLTSNKIKCITQDEKGFLWVGHENGLQRFDGRKFISFNLSDLSRMIPPRGVDEMLDAGNNNVWIRQGMKIGLFDLIKYRYKKVSASTVHTGSSGFQLYIDSKNKCFLTTGSDQIYEYDSVTYGFKNVQSNFHLPAGWPVTRMIESNTKQGYWFYGDSGVAMFDIEGQKLEYAGNNRDRKSIFHRIGKQKVGAFFMASDNTYWIAYMKSMAGAKKMAIVHFDPKRQTVLSDIILDSNPAKDPVEITRFLETANGVIWASGTGTTMSYNKESGRFFEHLQTSPSGYGLECNTVFHLYEDREKNLWLSTDNGVFMTGPAKTGVANISFSPGAGVAEVQSIIGTKKQEIWISTTGRGIIFLDSSKRKIPNPTPISGNAKKDNFLKNVFSLHQHSSNMKVWAGADAGYLMVIEPDTKEIISSCQSETFKEDPVKFIREDIQGNLWFASAGGRIAKWHNGDSAASIELITEIKTGITGFIIDKNDRKWIATVDNGLYLQDVDGMKTIQHFVHDDESPGTILSDNLSDFVQYNDSLFFAGTDGGFSVINIKSGSLINKTIYNGLPGTIVSQILPDKTGTVWLITNKGLSAYHVKKDFFTNYNQRDGIVNAHIATQAKLLLPNNDVWFAGENILLNFVPASLNSVRAPPPVTITDFRVFDNFHPVDSLLALENVTLENHEHTFSIYFSALNFTQQDKLNYYYMLEGVDRDWIYGDKSPMISYSVLSPGRYTFRVRCENLNGQSSAVTSLQLQIRPPFFKTWWFITIAIFVLASIVYWLYQQRVKRLLALERLRTKVARDLHDDMGSTLSTINILSTMAKSRMIQHPENASEYLSMISENSQQMMEVMDDIVWSIKPDNDSMQKITGRMRELATSLMEAKDIELAFVVDERIKNIKLNMEARRDFFLIYKEAVNNIVKYANATKVQIAITLHQRQLYLLVEDNGIGFDVEDADKGNGLGNMQKRAEAIDGKLSIHSDAGRGTQIQLAMPVQ